MAGGTNMNMTKDLKLYEIVILWEESGDHQFMYGVLHPNGCWEWDFCHHQHCNSSGCIQTTPWGSSMFAKIIGVVGVQCQGAAGGSRLQGHLLDSGDEGHASSKMWMFHLNVSLKLKISSTISHIVITEVDHSWCTSTFWKKACIFTYLPWKSNMTWEKSPFFHRKRAWIHGRFSYLPGPPKGALWTFGGFLSTWSAGGVLWSALWRMMDVMG